MSDDGAPMLGGHSESAGTPVFVPIALEMDLALVTLGALRAIFQSATIAGEQRNPKTALVAQAMVKVAEAIDARRTAAPSGVAGS